MKLKLNILCILVIALNFIVNVLSSPGSDWFEEQKRKSDEKFKNFDKDFNEKWNDISKIHGKTFEERKKEIEDRFDSHKKTAFLIGVIPFVVILVIVICCCCGCCVGIFFFYRKKKGRVITQNTQMTNQGATVASSNPGPASYNPVPTTVPDQTSGYGKYPAPPGQPAPTQSQYVTSSYPAPPSQPQYPAPPIQSAYNSPPITGGQAQYPMPPSGKENESYSRPQEPYNPNFTANTSSSYAPPPAYSGNIANTPVI